jgi:hypothetical protein
MNIIKKDNYAPFNCKEITFNDLVNDLELTGKKQNRIRLNYKLLNKERICTTQFTYSLKI